LVEAGLSHHGEGNHKQNTNTNTGGLNANPTCWTSFGFSTERISRTGKWRVEDAFCLSRFFFTSL
jgi:hypothetical protein